MNTIETLQTNYLNRACRTIDTILLTNEQKEMKVVYMYNYEGIHYRIFENILELSKFLAGNEYTVLKEYSHDRWVDMFLEKYQFSF